MVSFDHMPDHPESPYYVINDYIMTWNPPRIPYFAACRQTTEQTCGVLVLNHFGIKDYNEMQLADMPGTIPVHGTKIEKPADPYDVTDHYQDGYYIFPYGRFEKMWREGPAALNGTPYQQPFVAARS